MSLNPFYIVASDLESYFVDKDTGLPLANGTLSFYRDSARNVPKQVYQLSGDPPYSDSSYVSMGYQITLSAVGTVQNAAGDNEVIYWYPYDADGNLDLYYVVVANSAGTVQFTREAWPNGAAGGSSSSGGSQTNQISNPTFTNVFLNPGIDNVYNVASVSPEIFALGPDWYFEIAGTGSVTVKQVAIAGNQNVITNPPYVLDINVSAGITTCKLAQKFPINSGLWSSTAEDSIYLYGAFVAKNMDAGSTPILLSYEDGTDTSVTIVNTNAGASYALQSGSTTAPIPVSSNSETGVDGYVTVYFSFTAATHIQITSIQLIPLFAPTTSVLPIDIDSSNRNTVYQGDYYIPRSASKQIESFLVGWDFPVNPYQLTTSGTIDTTAKYITDQTIACGSTNTVVQWAQDSLTKGLQFTTTAANNSFYLMQYLAGDQVYNMLSTPLAANIFGYQTDVLASNGITMQVRLFRAPHTSSIPILPTSIGTVNAGGLFTPTASGWTEISRSGLPTATVTLSSIGADNSLINNGKNDYGFSGWQIDPTLVDGTSLFAMVVVFTYVNIGTIFTINSISLVPGDLSCRPAIKSFEATLQECQYYYEPGVNIFKLQTVYSGSTTTVMIVSPFPIDFNFIKRTLPTLTIASISYIFYSLASLQSSGSFDVSGWTHVTATQTTKSSIFVPSGDFVLIHSFPAVSNASGGIYLNYTVDARLGIV